MNKFISGIVTFSLKNRFFIFFMTALVIIAGIWSYVKTPLEAFPDVTNTQIIIVFDTKGGKYVSDNLLQVLLPQMTCN